jgi:hypothetical protein
MHTIPRIEIQESDAPRLAVIERMFLNYNPDRPGPQKPAVETGAHEQALPRVSSSSCELNHPAFVLANACHRSELPRELQARLGHSDHQNLKSIGHSQGDCCGL